MPDLFRFAAFRSGSVPRVPQPLPPWGTGWGTDKTQLFQTLRWSVPHVPRVPLQNDDAGNDVERQAAFDERFGILEHVEDLPRAEAERLAQEQVVR